MLLRSRQGPQVVVQHMDVRHRVGGAWVVDDEVVDFHVFALLKADAEIGFGQGTDIIANVGVLASHVDNHVTEWPFLDVLVLVGFQDAHEAEVLGRDLGVEVALKDGIRHLVTENDKTAAARTKQGFRTALNIFDDALITLVDDDEHRVNLLDVRQFDPHFLFRELVERLAQGSIPDVVDEIHAANVGKFHEMARYFGENR